MMKHGVEGPRDEDHGIEECHRDGDHGAGRRDEDHGVEVAGIVKHGVEGPLDNADHGIEGTRHSPQTFPKLSAPMHHSYMVVWRIEPA